VQAGAAEHVVLLDEGGFQAVLAGTYRSGVASWTATDDGDVINGLGQGIPLYEEMRDGKRLILEQVDAKWR
jgi:hypothetical protein